MAGMKNNFYKVQIFSGIKTVLKELKKDDIRMMILTSNTKESVSNFLEREAIVDFFEDVYFKAGLFAKHKIVNRIVKKNKLKVKEVLMIGDEVRDIDAARESKIKIAAVTWGFNGKNILEKNKPDFILNKPTEILDIINK
jgi:phosphoglycolate phosphatase-like HAD superfamily hydrolase